MKKLIKTAFNHLFNFIKRLWTDKLTVREYALAVLLFIFLIKILF